MPRRIGKVPKRKASKPSPNREAKDEKARYDRCRRRRWGLVKKAREYSSLFGAEVYLLMKDEQNAHYFTSEDRWIGVPQDVGAVRVVAPGRQRRQLEDDLAISETSSEGPPDTTSEIGEIQGAHAGFMSGLGKLRSALRSLVRRDDDAVYKLESSPEL
ncbi:hypothetical protein OHC33_009626 [Knufia fluminis]|uniref:MADS-box domain-containing protein n=1 Tax=Knufia fluminis TaxID=191047 RepID=A0AAN8EPF4_9EURO|nr:hypothetical protein OHC33_009626 [Knufia fluminis]